MLVSGPQYIGDVSPSAVFDIKFTTFAAATGAPTTLAGTPAISIYKDNNTTETTTGITLTVDFDSLTGLHNVNIDTANAFYASGSTFTVVITTGTVGGTSVVGYVVGSFSINGRSALRPTTAGRTLDVSAGGEAGVDWANVGSPTTTLALTGTSISTSQVVASVSGAVGSVTGNVGGNLLGTLSSTERNAIADANLNRDMSAVSDTNARSPLNALRSLRNRIQAAASTLTVYKEDDSTTAWSGALTTDAAAVPVTQVDPT